MPSVYIAGPDVFYPNARELAENARALAKQYGLTALIPTDNEVKDGTKQEISKAIFRANVQMIESADAVVANISPFRGPSADAGTVWEIGYARGTGKPVVAFSDDTRDYKTRAEKYPDGNMIEDFENVDNLMIAECLQGKVHRSIGDALKAVSEAL
ncbi:hypothetical protein B9G98_01003 [Wickerhamiella sorbophila]|uniref:Nucleoside 2-deoxyribosyltransferase n=1 Tax=Wickerhamiella sorbophila TaxID=45607 RepID=A0A2T0FEF5_9ASCO|nr:hypothetical protein B9G98_01003 [Wickerhamiella sorbophila]PRT53383.1 hypothetical protein B9G98_01003 [Wickerhamiella sorbophila]